MFHLLVNIEEMKNISVFLQGETTTVTFDRPIAAYALSLIAKEATVFWKFKNITSDLDNGEYTVGTVTKTLNPGYWDFQQLKEHLEGNKIEIELNTYDNTCRIQNKNTEKVNLKKLGKLLGFPEDHELAANKTGTSPNATGTSPNAVDVNHGLQYLQVECDFIDEVKNSWKGKDSTVLAFLPVTPGTRLNSTSYVYEEKGAPRYTKTSIVSKMVFTVKSNVPGLKVDADILMDITLE